MAAELAVQVEQALAAGVSPWQIIADPGLGFAKTHEGNCRCAPRLRRPLSPVRKETATPRSSPSRLGRRADVDGESAFRTETRLLKNLPRLRAALPGFLRRAPLLVGASRKGFLGTITGHEDARERDAASAAANALAVRAGANIVRTHNVALTFDAVRVAAAVARA